MVVPVEVSEEQTELHLQLRNLFLEKLDAEGSYDDYEDSDIERIRTDDAYCRRFILHKKGNLQNALEMAVEALKWRKTFGVKDVDQASLPQEFFEAKAVFPYNQDKEGNPIIMLLVRYHRRAPEFAKELRRFVIYWVELMEEQTSGGHMSVIMSCEGAGISNLDLDLIKFLITLFRSYYPDSLAHILIYEMPWILQPAWKIIKAWLPEDFVDKIKFVNKASIQDFVNKEDLPVDMGGTDTREYEPPTRNDLNRNSTGGTDQKRASNENGPIPSQVLITDDYTIIGGILKISPAVQLVFQKENDQVIDVAINLSNVSEKAISYKVKTNNIESYRVKPSVGIIDPGNTIEINVILISGFLPQASDRFLIMSSELPNSNIPLTNLNSFWKSVSSRSIADHKLKCVLKTDDVSPEDNRSELEKSLANITQMLSNIEKKVDSLESKHSSLEMKQLMSLCLTVFLVIVFLFHFTLSTDSPVVYLADKVFDKFLK